MAAEGPGLKMAAAPLEKMAATEKRRTSPAAAGGDPSRPAVAANGVPGGHSAACFLLEAGVTDMVRAAFLKVLEARPEEPVPFLAAYFEKLAQSSAEADEADAGDLPRQLQLRLDRATWALGLAHHSHRTAFDNNVGMAYDCLGTAGKRKKPGVNGKVYSELLRRLCREMGLPEEVAQSLLRKLLCREHEAVSFDLFRYGALTCLVLLEFVAKADTLYDALGGSGGADKRVCAAVLGALEEALRPSTAALPVRYLEAGCTLGPDRLALAMDIALAERKGGGMAMKKEEFLRRAASVFLSKVKAVN
ncbi:tubulin polyglutamylase complex subunit 1 [Anolis sagrei]|uniref:tubulin polyglutamylase complex subunit 1 n=1 Tax=Anolis sagrei TaxID=38937 RepID=UPI00351FD5A8